MAPSLIQAFQKIVLQGCLAVLIGISPCSRHVFAPLLNKLVYVLDSLMAGHYISQITCLEQVLSDRLPCFY